MENPSFTRLSEKQSRDLYSYLIPKMRKLLANPQKEVKSSKSSSTKTNKLQIQSESNVKISKEDFCEIVKIIKNESFNQLTSTLSVKEAVIVSLKIGSIDGKYFSTESISEFLGIETTEVIEITKRALLKYKDKINESSNEKKLERVLK